MRLQHEFTATDLKSVVQGISDAQESVLSYFKKMNDKFSGRVGNDRAKGTWVAYEYHYKILSDYLKKEYNIGQLVHDMFVFSIHSPHSSSIAPPKTMNKIL